MEQACEHKATKKDLFAEGSDKDGYTECRVGTDRLKFAACKDNLVVRLQVQMQYRNYVLVENVDREDYRYE